MGKWWEPCCKGCGTKIEIDHPQLEQGVHPGLRDEHLTGGVVWWGQREPRIPQIMCHDCVADMEASGEFNAPPGG